jgi:hypothetical protein
VGRGAGAGWKPPAAAAKAGAAVKAWDTAPATGEDGVLDAGAVRVDADRDVLKSTWSPEAGAWGGEAGAASSLLVQAGDRARVDIDCIVGVILSHPAFLVYLYVWRIDPATVNSKRPRLPGC